MRALIKDEIDRICGGDGIIESGCVIDFAGYLAGTAGLMLATGPLSFAVAAVGWTTATFSLDSCMDRAGGGFYTVVDEYGCQRVSS